MKKRLVAALLAAVMLLGGCGKEIDYSSITLPPEYTEKLPDPDADKDIMQETVIIPENFAKDTYAPSTPVVAPEDYEETFQLEFNSDSQTYTSGLTGFNGNGFICLGDHEYATVGVTVPSAQYYDVTVRLCSNGAKVAIIV